jgi:preprotein translocase subunit SecA
MGEQAMRNVERAVLLRAIDMLWMDHLDQMEHLRDSVRLRAYGQRDPLVEYKHEGVRLFRELQASIRTQVAHTIFKVGTVSSKNPDAPRRMEMKKPEVQGFIGGGITEERVQANSSSQTPTGEKEPNRNDPCWCGSGKKYKKCHGK